MRLTLGAPLASSRPFALVLLLAAPCTGQVTSRLSVDTAGGDGNHNSHWASVSRDGKSIAFYSLASDLVAGDKNGAYDVFVRDLVTGTTTRVSVDSAGVEAKSSSWYPALSADGNVVVFESDAKNLVANDNNGARDVFAHDRVTGVTERVSVDSAGVEANLSSSWASVSGDGRYVVFESSASNLVAGDTNGVADVFVHDRTTGVTTRVSVDSAGAEGNADSHLGAIADDVPVIVFSSFATNLVAGDTNFRGDAFVHDLATGTTERVSVDSAGNEGNHVSGGPAALSADGMLVVFGSAASNLVSGDTNAHSDIFVHDRATGTTERVSVDSAGVQGDRSSVEPEIADDGTSVTFYSYATNLVAGDANNRPDVFVHDRPTGFTERVSVDSSGGDGNGDCFYPSISGDGRIVAFSSLASDLVTADGNGAWDVFARDRCAVDASWTSYGAGRAGTLGVPSLAPRADPVLGTTLDVDLGNSAGIATPGLLFIGFQRAQVPWAGGDLLVQPFVVIPLVVPAAGATFTTVLPKDFRLGGFVLDLQAAELDAGAARGIASTAGLELVLGC
jgi:hypothetical protein